MGKDDDSMNPWVMRLGLLLLVLLCVSLFQSCQELRYAVGGRTAQTTVDKITVNKGRFGKILNYRLWRRVSDPKTKTTIEETVRVGANEVQDFVAGQMIDIEYIGNGPSNFDARLQGRH